MAQRLRIYSITGFRVLVSPNSWRRSTIYFKLVGSSINIVSVEIFTDDGMYLGTIMRQNFHPAAIKDMRAYIQAHKNNWHTMPANFLI